jgi:hypothetical protein
MASDTEVTWVAMEHASSGSQPSAEWQQRYYPCDLDPWCAYRGYNSSVNTEISPTFHVTHDRKTVKKGFTVSTYMLL